VYKSDAYDRRLAIGFDNTKIETNENLMLPFTAGSLIHVRLREIEIDTICSKRLEYQ
jgi:hypothetical protein